VLPVPVLTDLITGPLTVPAAAEFAAGAVPVPVRNSTVDVALFVFVNIDPTAIINTDPVLMGVSATAKPAILPVVIPAVSAFVSCVAAGVTHAAVVADVAVKTRPAAGAAAPETTTSAPVVRNCDAATVLVELVIVLFVKVSVVARPTRVSVASGNVIVRFAD